MRGLCHIQVEACTFFYCFVGHEPLISSRKYINVSSYFGLVQPSFQTAGFISKRHSKVGVLIISTKPSVWRFYYSFFFILFCIGRSSARMHKAVERVGKHDFDLVKVLLPLFSVSSFIFFLVPPNEYPPSGNFLGYLLFFSRSLGVKIL